VVSTVQKENSLAAVFRFFLLTYLFIWGASIPLITYLWLNGGSDAPLVLWIAVTALGNYSPLLAALLLTYQTDGRTGIQQLLRPLTWWRVSGYWYVVAFGYEAFVLLLAAATGRLLTGQWPAFPDNYYLWMLPLIFLIIFFQAGIAEEIGWRGYALPRLQSRWTALQSSLVLGVVWAFWHLPSYFVPGTYHYGRDLTFFGWYVLSVVATTIVMTWVFNGTRGSLMLVILLHTAQNTAVAFLPTDVHIGFIPLESLFYWIVALILVGVVGATNLARHERVRYSAP
jgi:uncharacterized protein